MSPNKSPKKQQETPKPVDFKTWKLQLEKFYRPTSIEGRALKCWMERKAADLTAIGGREDSQRDSLLEYAYRMTCPTFLSKDEREQRNSVTTTLTALLKQINKTRKVLNSYSQVMFPGGTPRHNPTLSKLSRNLEDATFYARHALIFPGQSYQRKADALSHCLSFLVELREYKISEPKAVKLGRLMMKAHGFSDDELIRFSIDSQRDGTPRKAKRKMILDFVKVMDSISELNRMHGRKYIQDRK
jgi:hypothetical protein